MGKGGMVLELWRGEILVLVGRWGVFELVASDPTSPIIANYRYVGVYLKQKRFVYCELGVYFLNQQSLKGGIVGKVMEKLCTVKNNVFFFFLW
jgi:hypothetical protein